MFLQVTFDDGSKLNIELTTLHTVQVIGPDNTVANAFNLGGVKDVSLEEGDVPAPVVADPVEPVVPPTSDPNTVLPPEPAPEPAPDPTTGGDATSVAPSSEPGLTSDSTDTSTATEPAPFTGPDAAVAGTLEDDNGTPVVAPTPTDGSTDPAHDETVETAQANIATVQGAHPSDAPTLAEMALADVNEALTQWPDSPALLDAKTQLEQLANPSAA